MIKVWCGSDEHPVKRCNSDHHGRRASSLPAWPLHGPFLIRALPTVPPVPLTLPAVPLPSSPPPPNTTFSSHPSLSPSACLLPTPPAPPPNCHLPYPTLSRAPIPLCLIPASCPLPVSPSSPPSTPHLDHEGVGPRRKVVLQRAVPHGQPAAGAGVGVNAIGQVRRFNVLVPVRSSTNGREEGDKGQRWVLGGENGGGWEAGKGAGGSGWAEVVTGGVMNDRVGGREGLAVWNKPTRPKSAGRWPT